VLLMTHGWAKVMQIVDGQAGQWADPIGLGPHASLWLSAFAEFLCALLVVLGVKTRWFAVPIVVNMAVAVLIAHADDPFGRKELALLYLVVFLALAFTGGGGWSFDGWLGKRRRHRR
jgi:putative oxidoreductase